LTDRAAARRAAIRRHHPDAGGSAAALIQALDGVERAYRRPADGAPIIIVHRSFALSARALLKTASVRLLNQLNVIRRFTLQKDRS
jgi:hypothetical protein